MEQMIANRTNERMFASKMMKQFLTHITTKQMLANKTNQKLVKSDRANASIENRKKKIIENRKNSCWQKKKEQNGKKNQICAPK